MRIAYDVTPLSHPRTGVGNYILGALKGMAEAADGSHELVAFGPVSIRGRKLLDSTLVVVMGESSTEFLNALAFPLSQPVAAARTRWPLPARAAKSLPACRLTTPPE